MSFTEDNYEKAVIALFEQMGYRYLYGPDIERDYYVPFYEEQLLLSLANLNRGKPQAALQEAVGKLKDIDTGSLAQKNERFMDYLQHGIEVSYFDGREQRNDLVYLIDYAHTERNDFQIVNQWTFVEHSEKRADLVVFVNGLPLVVMELKSPSREETDASEAYRQLQLHAGDSVAVCVQRFLRNERHGLLEGRNHYQQGRPLHGMENQGRRL